MSTRYTTLVLALCCGITAANVYLVQPIAVALAHSFDVSDDAAGTLVSAIQIAYAVGIVLFVPILDHVRARSLLIPLFAASTTCLAVMATTSSWIFFVVAACLLGLVCPIPQIIIPASISTAGTESAARVVGFLQAGLLFGLLGARFYAGAIATSVSVRAVFAISCALTAVAGALAVIALRNHCSRSEPVLAVPGVAFIRGIPLLARPPHVVAGVCLSGLSVGFAFGAFWNSLTFLGDRWYHLDAAEIGLFGLVAAVSGAISPLAGRSADRWGSGRVQTVACALIVLGWLALLFGRTTIYLIVFATVVIDVGVWSNQVVNQATVLTAPTVPRGLANTAYFGARFLGIALGSAVGSTLLLADRWPWAVVASCAATVLGLVIYRINIRAAIPSNSCD